MDSGEMVVVVVVIQGKNKVVICIETVSFGSFGGDPTPFFVSLVDRLWAGEVQDEMDMSTYKYGIDAR